MVGFGGTAADQLKWEHTVGRARVASGSSLLCWTEHSVVVACDPGSASCMVKVCTQERQRNIERERKKPQTADEEQVCGEQVTSGGELRG